MVETIFFINKKGEPVAIESSDGNWYAYEDFDYDLDASCKISRDLLFYDGWGLPYAVRVDKAYKPCKFYKLTWYEVTENTENGFDSTVYLDNIEEIDYINSKGEM